MAAHIRLTMDLADVPLLNETIDHYNQAVENGQMTEREAWENTTALALGMLEIKTGEEHA